MAATQHAYWMMAQPVFTAIICGYLAHRLPTFRRTLIAIFLSLPIFFFPNHLCDAGYGGIQRFIGGCCLAAAIAFVTDRRAAAGLAIVFFLAGVGLVLHYDDLVHGEVYIGRQTERLGPRTHKSRALEAAVQAASDLPDALLPAGWVSDDERLKSLLRSDRRYHREAGERLWHSGFTSLYLVRRTPVELWFPGGPPREAASGLEWRERPKP